MARRRATRKYETVFEFVQDYSNSLKDNAINLPAGSFRGELANTIKLDLSIPDFGRIGPIEAQVIFRDPSGSVALRLPAPPMEMHEVFAKAKEQCIGQAQPFVDAGLLVFAEDHNAKVQELEEKLTSQQQEWEQRLKEEIAKLQAETESKLEALREELEAQKAAAPVVQIDRGIPIVDFSGLDARAEGKMDSLHDFLIEAGKKQWTGLLYIDQGTQRRFAYLDKGAVVAWRSDPMIEKEVLGVLLFNFKQITKEQLEQSLAVMEEKKIRQGEAFVELGFMTFPQMVTVLSKQVEYIFQQVRKQKKGSFSFYETSLPEKFLSNKLYYINLLVRDLRLKTKRLSSQVLFKKLSTSLSKKVYLDSELLPVLRFVSFTPPERKTMQMIQSRPVVLRDLMKMAPLPKTEVNTFFWIMDELGAFSYDAPSKPNQVSQPKIQALDPNQILHQKIQEIEKGTYFDVLGVHWICVNADIEKGFAEQSKTVELLKGKSEYELIRSGIQEAYASIKSPEDRRSYRARLFHSSYHTDAALLLAKRAEAAIGKDKTLACGCFAKAIELCPEESSYKEGLKRAVLS